MGLEVLPCINVSFHKAKCLHHHLRFSVRLYFSLSRSLSLMERANGGGSGGHRIKVIKYKECCRNHSPPGAAISFDGCRSFVKNRLAIEDFCATCGCRKNFHRRYESYRPAPRFQSLHHLATVAAAAAAAAEAGQQVPPSPTGPPPPQAAPPPTPPSPPTILESASWAETDEKNKPLKKRKARFFAQT